MQFLQFYTFFNKSHVHRLVMREFCKAGRKIMELFGMVMEVGVLLEEVHH